MRLIVIVIALALIGWLAVMERDAQLYDRGLAAAGKLDDAQTVERAERDLRDARLLNPDRTPDVARALVIWRSGRPAQARTLLEGVVRAEPDNLGAWTALGWVNAGKDSDLARRVTVEMRRLDPVSRDRRPATPSPPPPA